MKDINGAIIGRISGYLHFVLMAVMVPYLILKCDTYAKSLDNFDPLSELGNSPETRLQFQFTFVIGGILLLLYVNLYFASQRELYYNFRTFRFSIFALNVGGLGQIGVGIFPRDMFPHHLLATLFYVAGLGAGITTLSLDLENNLEVKRIGIRLSYAGYIICTLSFLNIFYFRYTQYRGIWQIGTVAIIIFWYVFEEAFHQSISSELSLSMPHYPIQKMNRIAYIMIFTSIILIAFGLLMRVDPTTEPWGCTSSDQERCSVTTVLSIIVSGILLLLFVLLYYYKVIYSNLHRIVDKSIRIKFGRM